MLFGSILVRNENDPKKLIGFSVAVDLLSNDVDQLHNHLRSNVSYACLASNEMEPWDN